MTGNESSISKSDLLFHLYECEYESADNKENRSMLRSCIYILEGTPESERSPRVLSALAKLYWSCNNYELAKTTCLELLKIQPLAMEAVTILSRLNDFKGMKTETQLPPDSLSPLQSSLKQAEYSQLQQPARSLTREPRRRFHSASDRSSLRSTRLLFSTSVSLAASSRCIR